MASSRIFRILTRSSVSFRLGWTMVAFVCVFSLIPGGSLPKMSWPALVGLDKWGHFICYGWSCCFLLISYKAYTNLNYLSVVIPVGLFTKGIVLEYLQAWLRDGRTFDLWDILANALGIFAGQALGLSAVRKMIA